MSVDWFLYSPSHRRSAMIGSVGLSGVQSCPAAPEVIEFVRWVIDEGITDVVMVDEHALGPDQDSEPEPAAAGGGGTSDPNAVGSLGGNHYPPGSIKWET